MMALLVLACGSPDPARRARVEEIADLAACVEPPEDLRILPLDAEGEKDAAEIRRRVSAWVDTDPPGPTRFPDDVAFSVGYAFVRGWDPGQGDAAAYVLRSLDRCGNATAQMVALAVGAMGCGQQDPSFLEALPELSPLPSVAARETLWALDLAEESPGWFMGYQRRELERQMTDWVLADPFVPPVGTMDRLRPVASMILMPLAQLWPDLLDQRARYEACRAAPTGGVMVHEGTMALFFPQDAVDAVPQLAEWSRTHPGWNAVPSELDTPELRGRLAATGCGQAATDVKGTVPWSELRWVQVEELGYDTALREDLAIPESPAWVLPLGPDAAAPWRVLSTPVPPAPIGRCRLPEEPWLLRPTAVVEGADRYGTLAVPITVFLLEAEGDEHEELVAIEPGFRHDRPGHDLLWDHALEHGAARLLSPRGTVTRFVDRDGWWTTEGGERIWPRLAPTP